MSHMHVIALSMEPMNIIFIVIHYSIMGEPYIECLVAMPEPATHTSEVTTALGSAESTPGWTSLGSNLDAEQQNRHNHGRTFGGSEWPMGGQ